MTKAVFLIVEDEHRFRKMGVLSHPAGDAGRGRERGLERLRVSALLFEQAADKRAHGELMESLELRAEARALRREGYAMLNSYAARRDCAAAARGAGSN